MSVKKILVVFSGTKFPEHVLSYAIDIAHASQSLLTGIFLHPMLPDITTYPFLNDMSANMMPIYDPQFIHEDAQAMQDHKKHFKEICDIAGVQQKVHEDKGIPLQELLQESAFADLIIMDVKADINGFLEETLNTSLKDLLADAHCPVLLVPEKVQIPQQVVLAYDGSFSGIFAIKMFSYVFPEWKNLPAHVVAVNAESSNHLQEGHFAKELLSRHFTNLHYEILHGDVRKELPNHLRRYEGNSLLVMGAYGRSALSRLLRQSLANLVMEKINIALFVTHE